MPLGDVRWVRSALIRLRSSQPRTGSGKINTALSLRICLTPSPSMVSAAFHNPLRLDVKLERLAEQTMAPLEHDLTTVVTWPAPDRQRECCEIEVTVFGLESPT
jgi:hypothetical protein